MNLDLQGKVLRGFDNEQITLGSQKLNLTEFLGIEHVTSTQKVEIMPQTSATNKSHCPRERHFTPLYIAFVTCLLPPSKKLHQTKSAIHEMWRAVADLLLLSLLVIADFSIKAASFIFRQLTILAATYSHPPGPDPDATAPVEEAPEFTESLIREREGKITDMIAAEATYRSQLELLKGVFRPQLEGVISDEDMRIFFGNIDPLIAMSRAMSDALSSQYREHLYNSEIWRCFDPKTCTLNLFVPYIQHFNEAVDVLDSLLDRNKQFARVIQTIESQNPDNLLDFRALIAAPVQQISRYILMLRDLLRATPKNHPDQRLENTIELLNNTAKIAKGKRTEEVKRNQIIALQNAIKDCPPLVAPSRKLLAVFQLTADRTELHLMTDMFIITKNKRKKYKVLKENVSLKNVISASRDPAGVKIVKDSGSEMVIRITNKADDLVRMLNAQIQKLMMVRVRAAQTT